VRLVVDDAEETDELVMRESALRHAEQRVEVGADGGERRAQLVRHRRHEGALERVDFLHPLRRALDLLRVARQLAIELRVLDRDQRVVSEDLEQLDILARRDHPVGRVVHREVGGQVAVPVVERNQQHIAVVPFPLLAHAEVRDVVARQNLVERLLVTDEVRVTHLELVPQPREEVVHVHDVGLHAHLGLFVQPDDRAGHQVVGARLADTDRHDAIAEAHLDGLGESRQQCVGIQLGV
jgi:hypothetical protein